MKRLFRLIPILLCALMLAGCGLFGTHENKPYEPDTQEPAPHEGLFTCGGSSMRFFGDGERVILDLDEELARLAGLPAGEHEGTYVFLSGDLPPLGSMPVRYDTAHELRITVGEVSAVIELGIINSDGKTASSGVGCVTEERIPLLFSAEGLKNAVFTKAASD